MRKLILLSVVVLASVAISCDKEPENERTIQTFYADVTRIKDDSVSIPDYTIVWIFDTADFDFSTGLLYESIYFADKGEMTLKDGSRIKYKYKSRILGKQTLPIESVENGEYCIFVFLECDIDYEDTYLTPYTIGYRKITVDKDIHQTTLKFVFTEDDRRLVDKWFTEK